MYLESIAVYVPLYPERPVSPSSGYAHCTDERNPRVTLHQSLYAMGGTRVAWKLGAHGSLDLGYV